MNKKALTAGRLALLNIGRKPFRTAALITVVTLLAFVVFGGSILFVSMQNGMGNLENRLGADIIVVPEGNDAKMEGMLMRGEPSIFYFDKEIIGQVAAVEGVELVTPQFYLASFEASCCAVPAPIIGFDPETDFTVTPWIKQIHDGDIEGSLIVGNSIVVEEDNTIEFFGRTFPVAAKLDRTGSGLDGSVFTNMNTMDTLVEASIEKGMVFEEGVTPEASVSSILVKLADGYRADWVALDIRRAIDGVQTVATDSMVTNIGSSLGSFISFIYVFAAAFWVLALVLLSIVFSVTANERKKEFSLMRILGATRKHVMGVLLKEALYISGIGAAAGISLAALIVFPFSTYIGNQLGMPYMQPNTMVTGLILLGSLLVGASVGPLASVFSAWKISRAETYHTMREGE